MILIVGGAGYIGSHVNLLLNQRGYETVVFDNLCSGHKEAVVSGHFLYGDLNDREALERVMNEYDISLVMHFGAFAYVGESVIHPEIYYYNNVVNTLNLLSAMRKCNVKKIIFSSTCAVYGDAVIIPIPESAPKNPINPYGKTKLMIESILQDYCKAYGMEYVCLRYFNAAGAESSAVIGESHEPETHIIPKIFDAVSGRSDKFVVYGDDYETPDGTCVRDYLHVSDIAEAHLCAARHLLKTGESNVFNLSNKKGYSVLDIIHVVEKVVGKKLNYSVSGRREGDPSILVGDSTLIRSKLGWNPKHEEIEEIIRDAWNWYCNKKY